MTDLPPIRIATRASALAMWQAEHVSALLQAAGAQPEGNGRGVELVQISTIGDRDQSAPLHEMGGQGVFTKEVQRALLDGRADVAVHSLKDLPTEDAPGLRLAAVPERAPVTDVLVLPNGHAGIKRLKDLPAGTRVGTGSLRRQAQLLHQHRSLQLLEIRGNVPTRIEKLDRGDYDAIVLAQAGLERLGLAERISFVLPAQVVFPAVGQGALGLECRADDETTQTALATLIDPGTFAAVRAERRLLSTLRAGCHAPVGARTEIVDDQLWLAGVVLSRDGRKRLFAESTGPLTDPEAVGQAVADTLLSAGAERLMNADAS